MVVRQDNGQLGVDNPKQVFYGLVPEPQSSRAVNLIRDQSRTSLSTPGSEPAWLSTAFDGRRAYWTSSKDNAIPQVAQQAFIQNSAVEWDVKDFPSDHSPFSSFPSDLSSWIVEKIVSWQVKSIGEKLTS